MTLSKITALLPTRMLVSCLVFLTGTCCSLTTLSLTAQVHTSVFEDLSGADLKQAIVTAYSPTGQLDYGIARDTLFAKVFRQNDELECQYTGFRVDLPNGVDPTIFAFDQGINTEHIYPRSKGADRGNALADMHHLYPTRERVNADRASFPFADIPDNQTLRWYYLDQQRSTPPSANRDAYSEGTNAGFEPRELQKGDVARAMFYFYTIYRDEALAADPSYFSSQVETLCDWHMLDPISADEYDRTLAIAAAQGNANPFVLDCTVADRIGYCSTRARACQLVTTSAPSSPALLVYPTPTSDQLSVTLQQEIGSVRIIDALGVTVFSAQVNSPETTIALPLDLPGGLYNLYLQDHRINRRFFLDRL